MTFEQFQATRRPTADLEAEINTSIYDDPVIKVPGLVYLGGLYIEESHANWTDAAREGGKYFLTIANRDWLSDDLETLERHLYDFAVSEGFTDNDSRAVC